MGVMATKRKSRDLRVRKNAEVQLTLEQAQAIIRTMLPPSARAHSPLEVILGHNAVPAMESFGTSEKPIVERWQNLLKVWHAAVDLALEDFEVRAVQSELEFGD